MRLTCRVNAAAANTMRKASYVWGISCTAFNYFQPVYFLRGFQNHTSPMFCLLACCINPLQTLGMLWRQ